MGTSDGTATQVPDLTDQRLNPPEHLEDGRCLLVSIVETARLLSVGRSKVYELIGDGQLETVHIGRSVRVPRDAIADYVERLRSSQHGNE